MKNLPRDKSGIPSCGFVFFAAFEPIFLPHNVSSYSSYSSSLLIDITFNSMNNL